MSLLEIVRLFKKTSQLPDVDARLMGYKLEQFQSPRMHSSVTTGNSNTIQENKSTSYRHWFQDCGHKHATALQRKAVV